MPPGTDIDHTDIDHTDIDHTEIDQQFGEAKVSGAPAEVATPLDRGSGSAQPR